MSHWHHCYHLLPSAPLFTHKNPKERGRFIVPFDVKNYIWHVPIASWHKISSEGRWVVWYGQNLQCSGLPVVPSGPWSFLCVSLGTKVRALPHAGGVYRMYRTKRRLNWCCFWQWFSWSSGPVRYSLVDVEFPKKMNRFFTQWMLRIACRSNSTAYSWMATNAAGELCMASQGSSQNFRDLMFSWGLSVECWNRSTTHPKIRVKFAKPSNDDRKKSIIWFSWFGNGPFIWFWPWSIEPFFHWSIEPSWTWFSSFSPCLQEVLRRGFQHFGIGHRREQRRMRPEWSWASKLETPLTWGSPTN